MKTKYAPIEQFARVRGRTLYLENYPDPLATRKQALDLRRAWGMAALDRAKNTKPVSIVVGPEYDPIKSSSDFWFLFMLPSYKAGKTFGAEDRMEGSYVFKKHPGMEVQAFDLKLWHDCKHGITGMISTLKNTKKKKLRNKIIEQCKTLTASQGVKENLKNRAVYRFFKNPVTRAHAPDPEEAEERSLRLPYHFGYAAHHFPVRFHAVNTALRAIEAYETYKFIPMGNQSFLIDTLLALMEEDMYPLYRRPDFEDKILRWRAEERSKNTSPLYGTAPSPEEILETEFSTNFFAAAERIRTRTNVRGIEFSNVKNLIETYTKTWDRRVLRKAAACVIQEILYPTLYPAPRYVPESDGTIWGPPRIRHDGCEIF